MKARYSIKDLEHLSGIKAHTIRIWEQRHNIIEPKRTETNIRFYEDEDLRRLLNVSFLVHEGVKISKVASLSDADRNLLVMEKAATGCQNLPEVNDFKLAMYNYDALAFGKTYELCVSKYGIEKTFTDVIGTFLTHIGLLWQTNTISVTHEHFVSNLVKQKIYSAIDKLSVPNNPKALTYLLYLPAAELHEMGLLYLQFMLLKSGHNVIYLGQNLPADFVNEIYERKKFDRLVSIYTTAPNTCDVDAYLLAMKKSLAPKNVKLYACGGQLNNSLDQFRKDETLILHQSLAELSAALGV